MDLHTIQTRLKAAIQNHQIMVLKMRGDPQNISLQKHLHDLQAEIISLSEKQKQAVEQLRKDIEQKQCHQQPPAPCIQRLVQPTKTLTTTNNNNNQVIIEFSTQNNSCKILSSVASPIRVPHYQPALSAPNVQKPKVTVTPVNNEPATVLPVKPPSTKSLSVTGKLEKCDFMAALGLITKCALDELQSKKVERKRRTTANPHFSNSALDERKKVSNGTPPAFKRPRGRPRLTSSPIAINNSTSAVVNGHIPNGISKSENSIKEDLVSVEKCATCNESNGELISCNQCSSSFHLSCVDLTVVPSSKWSCSRCKSSIKNCDTKGTGPWTNSLAIVHSLIALKSSKSEEKQKLVKRSLELKTEKAQLEHRVRQLTDVLSSAIEKHKSLLNSNKKMQQSVNSIQSFVKLLHKS